MSLTSTLTQKSIEELEIDDGELRALRQRLVMEKTALQSQLNEINTQCRVRLPTAKFQQLQSRRGQIARQLMDKEREISDVNARRHELLTVKEVRKEQSSHLKVADIKKLIAIRDEWHDFSMDNKNDPVKRRMAWHFSQQLKEFLKPYFAPEPVVEESIWRVSPDDRRGHSPSIFTTNGH